MLRGLRLFQHEEAMKQTDLKLNQHVRIEGHCVLKKVTSGPAYVRLIQAAHALSKETQNFYVPKVLDYDEKTRTVKLEYLPDLISLKQYFSQHKEIARMLYRVGDALASCHRGLQIPIQDRTEAWVPWIGLKRDQVVVHGDFNMINLCYSADRDRLVILDWETSPALPFQCNWGSRYLDIVQFIRNLLLQQHSLGKSVLQFRKRVKIFLTAYQQTSGICLDMRRLNHRLYDYNLTVIKKQLSQFKCISTLRSILGCGVFRTHLKGMNVKTLAGFSSCCGLEEQISGGIHG